MSLSVSLLLLVFCTMSVSASDGDSGLSSIRAINNGIYLDAESKQDFAEEMDRVYEEAMEKNEIIKVSNDDVEQLMVKVAFADGNEKLALLEQLEMCGVYQYNKNIDVELYSDSSDVTIKAPNIFYSASANTWTVSCQGNWKNSNWNTGGTGNIGGYDGFGVAYTKASGYNTSVVGSSAYIADQNGNNMKKTSYRSDGNGAQGFGFQLQDYVSGTKYIGYRWYGSCTYGSNFANFSGIATAYYVHTYETAYIKSVTFTGGSQPGVSIEIANQSHAFKAYSTDTRF